MTNQLFYGDNYEVLQNHIQDESIDLVYIDPPFNSKRNYNQIYNNIGTEDKAQAQAFVDTWEWNLRAERDLKEILYSNTCTVQTKDLILGLEKVLKKGTLLAYITSMTLRINEIWRVLKPTGSFYLHCDPTASHYLKLLCDTIFCANRGGEFRNEIIWGYIGPSGAKKDFPKKHDTIFRYTKSDIFTFNPDNVRIPYSAGFIKRRKYSEGKAGIYADKSKGRNENELKEFQKGKLPPSWWNDIKSGGQMPRGEHLGYPTQKPLALLERIILASSNEGDTVLDAYCGCGTTVHASQKLNRKWIGIDITYQSISLIIKRLEDAFGKENINININPPAPLKGGVSNIIQVFGIPRDMNAAIALAHKKDDRVRKEFEKWAVLTYSNNRAMINDKKGGDGGIDGISRFPKTSLTDLGTVIFSVKSDKIINPSYIRDLAGTILKEKADMGILICLNEPSKGVRQTAFEYGTWINPYNKTEYPKIQIITIKEIVEENKRLDNVLAGVVLKQAQWTDTTKQKNILNEKEEYE